MVEWPNHRNSARRVAHVTPHTPMGCVCGKPAVYDDHATAEERRARALHAAESRSQASDRRGIKVRGVTATRCAARRD
jgi:hypothetical protein